MQSDCLCDGNGLIRWLTHLRGQADTRVGNERLDVDVVSLHTIQVGGGLLNGRLCLPRKPGHDEESHPQAKALSYLDDPIRVPQVGTACF